MTDKIIDIDSLRKDRRKQTRAERYMQEMKDADLISKYSNVILEGNLIHVVGPAEDIDLILEPKGEGSVDVTGTKIINVADGVAATDAPNLSQVECMIIDYLRNIELFDADGRRVVLRIPAIDDNND